MEVILQEDVPNLGKAGEVVKVRDGYGRNFLLLRKKAVLADTQNLKMLEHHKRVVAAKQEKLKAAAAELSKKIAKIKLSFAREAGEVIDEGEGLEKLFGSVTAKDIAEAIRNEGVIVDRRDIQLQSPIKQLGEHDVPVRLHAEVIGTIKVIVVRK